MGESYSGFITWLSRVDLPGVDRYVYVRIIPFDNDIGVSDTIVFRLDNNYPPVVKIDSVFGVKRVTGAYRDTLRFYFTVVGDSLLSDSTRYEGSVIWLTREDLPGVDDTVMLFSGLHRGIMTHIIGVSDSVLIQIDNLGVPRVGILNTFAGEYRDSVRFDYRVLDEEGEVC